MDTVLLVDHISWLRSFRLLADPCARFLLTPFHRFSWAWVVGLLIRKLKEDVSWNLDQVQTPNFSWAEPNLNYTGKTDVKLDLLHLLTLNTKLQRNLAFCIRRSEKHPAAAHEAACKTCYDNLCTSGHENLVRRLNPSRSKVAPKPKFPAWLSGKNEIQNSDNHHQTELNTTKIVLLSVFTLI